MIVKVYDWVVSVLVIGVICWGGWDIVATAKAKDRQRIADQDRRIRTALYGNVTNWEQQKAVADYYGRLFEIRRQQERKLEEARNRQMAKLVSIVVQSEGDEEDQEEPEEAPTRRGYSSWNDVESEPPRITRTTYSPYKKTSDSYDDETFSSGWKNKSLTYAQRDDEEISARLDDFVGAIEPRMGQTIKTGSTAFREDGDMVIVTGSTIHTSRGMWVDTGGVILGPQGQSMLRVGDMIYENGIIKSQQIGGRGGDYYLRRGYSLNQSSQTLTDFDSP